jgi:protein-S-isoprenylcysteine O-methyltransferase Ste14
VRSQPLVREGIFAWAPNAMYIFGFLLLWIPPFLFQSVTALVVAAFGHAYIWVHYFFTEKPDMQLIYG